MTDDAIIRVCDLRKSYGDLTVLEDFSLEVPAGQRLAIIGTSGSGKSTLLRLIMGLDQPDAGSILIDGDDLWHERLNGRTVPAGKKHVRRVRGKVGMIFQHFNLFPHMTALENVTDAPIHVLGLSKSQARERGVELLEKVGLGNKSDSYPGELSGGQKQRVAIARALAMEPQVMLLDEVTSALDPELVGEVQSVLKDLARETRMSFLVVTHDILFARDIAQRIIFLDGGRIVEDNESEALLNHPEQPRTREFLKLVLERYQK